MINVTDSAATHLLRISEDNEGKIPCLGLKGGGCAGFSYDWHLKDESELDKKADHVIMLNNGAKMAVDGSSIMYLIGTTLELKKDTFGTTLEIVNPNSASSCGCGESVNFDLDKVEANQAQISEIK
tara:strand:+ start:365 stop:742 length:378 start_codon:yes stop_codon:yes gene_type:complete